MYAGGGFDEFMVEHQSSLLRLAMTLTGDYRRSEELVGDVLAAAYERWVQVSEAGQPVAYVRRMLVNEFISQNRRRSRWQRLAPLIFTERRAVEDSSDAVGERSEMLARLSRLAPRQRAVLALRYYLDLPDEQIAELLGCRPATVRSHAARALAALRIDLTTKPSVGPQNKPATKDC